MSEKIIWRCPSNIALVKYWGKKGQQIPCNASLSMTLQNAFTEAELTLQPKNKKIIELEYFFNMRRHPDFEERIRKYLEQNEAQLPVLKEFAVNIHSTNSFPHSTGIASSASAFGAIALCLLSASGFEGEGFLQRASFLSRLGSGSACRSMYGRYALWGRLPEMPASSDEYAVPVRDIHKNFSDMRDTILIVEDAPKRVSSSAGHALMKDHPFAESRFRQANLKCARILQTLREGDFEQFIIIIEQEALALHAMMMTSADAYLLMKPGTIHAIEMILNFRKETGIPVCYTLDAGPNVHVLYPGQEEEKVEAFLSSELQGGLKGIIYDRIGKGPEKISC